MKAMLARTLNLALLLGATSLTPLVAQETKPSPIIPPGCVGVKKGDGFWRIAEREIRDPKIWKRIWELNPNRKDGSPRRIYIDPETKWTYIWTEPGELLCGLQELGLGEPVLTTPQELEKMGFKVSKVEKVEVPVPVPFEVKKTPVWSWALLGSLGLPLAVGLVAIPLLRRDPTRVGRGRVQEQGIHTASAAVEHFRHYNPGVPVTGLVRGRGYGYTRVGDVEREEFKRLLNGEEVWQATVRPNTGPAEFRYSLLACANDVKAGGGMIPVVGFRFVPIVDMSDQIPPEQPEPQIPPPTEESQPAEQSGAAESNGAGGDGPRLIEGPGNPPPAEPEPVHEPSMEILAPERPAAKELELEDGELSIAMYPDKKSGDTILEATGGNFEKLTITRSDKLVRIKFRTVN